MPPPGSKPQRTRIYAKRDDILRLIAGGTYGTDIRKMVGLEDVPLRTFHYHLRKLRAAFPNGPPQPAVAPAPAPAPAPATPPAPEAPQAAPPTPSPPATGTKDEGDQAPKTGEGAGGGTGRLGPTHDEDGRKLTKGERRRRAGHKPRFITIGGPTTGPRSLNPDDWGKKS